MRRYVSKQRECGSVSCVVRNAGESRKNVGLSLKMHHPCHGTMVDCTVGGISSPFHDPLSGQTSDACRWKWKQRRSHRSRSMAC
ncbi:hypothetical protein KPH14_011326 [Odynerus spinipes]|uniref:Uncharacterized protein n=1 Tax=Odynerus spinipes TaxID=1348599 RepID=A0AAD9VMX7_9HYME|nr:hypothetical protein KPH14_011326 [Odynerus spinipes]